MDELKCPCGLRNHMDSEDCRKTLCCDCCPLQKKEEKVIRPGRLTLPHHGGKGHYMKCSEQLGCSGKCEDCEDLDALVDRLAAYEDTGLEPAEVKDMAENAETRLLTWFEAKYGFAVGQLMDMCEAKQKGRLVVLPFKVGDHVWINGILGVGECEEHQITSVNVRMGEKREVWVNAEMVGYMGEARCAFGLDQIGKTVFLTREEAEKALEAPHEA